MSAEIPERLDSATVSALYADYADELRAFLHGVVRNPDLASEALQATFVKVLEAGHTAHRDTFKGWLFKVALNEALGLKRRIQRDASVSRRPVWRSIESESPPDASLIRRETAERVARQIGELPPEQREVVRLRIFEELTFADIAQRLNLPLGTVLTRMRSALKKISDSLSGHPDHTR